MEPLLSLAGSKNLLDSCRASIASIAYVCTYVHTHTLSLPTSLASEFHGGQAGCGNPSASARRTCRRSGGESYSTTVGLSKSAQ